ncbi:MAG: AraC family transcriptional regulator [Xanthomonadales bacterium]|jgi:AraC-like DNA-binding protein|nr:AraC family transcriptional regulator [Xanthomonadales bacterium]
MPSPAARPALHPAYLRLLVAVLARQRIDAAPLFREAGIPIDAPGGEALIDVAQLETLVAAAVRVSGKPWLGLELGAAAQVLSHGPLGLAAAASGTVRDALTLIARYLVLRAPWLSLTLRASASRLELVLTPMPGLAASRRVLLEAALVMLEQLIVGLSAADAGEIEVELPWRAPERVCPGASALRARCRYRADADAARMTLRPGLAAAPVLSADPAALAYARAECQRRLAERAAGRELRAAIRRRLADAHGPLPDAASMAQSLGRSLRSFHRDLAAEGTRWQTLLDEVRCDRACWLLTETRKSITEIALELGFAEPSNFSRVFRRWLGRSPSEYRAARPPANPR